MNPAMHKAKTNTQNSRATTFIRLCSGSRVNGLKLWLGNLNKICHLGRSQGKNGYMLKGAESWWHILSIFTNAVV